MLGYGKFDDDTSVQPGGVPPTEMKGDPLMAHPSSKVTSFASVHLHSAAGSSTAFHPPPTEFVVSCFQTYFPLYRIFLLNATRKL